MFKQPTVLKMNFLCDEAIPIVSPIGSPGRRPAAIDTSPVLGSGAYGTVYRCDGVAIKKMKQMRERYVWSDTQWCIDN
jgi:hypothetical protein